MLAPQGYLGPLNNADSSRNGTGTISAGIRAAQETQAPLRSLQAPFTHIYSPEEGGGICPRNMLALFAHSIVSINDCYPFISVASLRTPTAPYFLSKVSPFLKQHHRCTSQVAA